MTQTGPHFIGIGAQRAGTTWINDMLADNPAVWMPPIKEVHYFDIFPAPGRVSAQAREHLAARLRAWLAEPLRSGAPVKRPADLAAMARFDLGCLLGRRGVERYLRLFRRPAAAGMVTGEITPAYALLTPAQIARLRAALRPDLRVFVILRDPIDRMWSHASMQFHRKGAALGAASAAEQLAVLQGASCRDRTRYARTLAAWRDAFGAENLLVMHFDDIRARPLELVAALERFIGVPAAPARAARPGVNSYGAGGARPEGEVLRALAAVSAEECRALIGVDPSPHPRRWLERAEAILAGRSDAA